MSTSISPTIVIEIATSGRAPLRLRMTEPPGSRHLDAARDFRVSADDPDHRVSTRPGGEWQRAAWRPERVRVAVSGDWFRSKKAARDAARQVQQQACTAIGP